MKPLACVLALALPASLPATLIVDAFDYGPSNGTLSSLTTSETAGWGASTWSGSAVPQYDAAGSLTFANAGYGNSAVGGRLLAGITEATVTRSLASPQSGPVWLSMLVDSTFWNATNTVMEGFLTINGNAGDLLGFSAFGGMVPSAAKPFLRLSENGSPLLSAPIGGADFNIGILLAVAKLETNVSGTSDRITFWAFRESDTIASATVAGLGTPDYVSSLASGDIWGDSITSFGLQTQRPNNETRLLRIDNFRISVGAPDDDAVGEVLGIPEPSSAAPVFALGAAALVAARRRGGRLAR